MERRDISIRKIGLSLSIIFAVLACGRQDHRPETSGPGFQIQDPPDSNGATVTYSTWCRDWRLTPCPEGQPSDEDPKIWLGQWVMGRSLVQSPTKVELMREEYTHNLVQEFLKKTHALGALEFMSSLPWRTVVLDGDEFKFLFPSSGGESTWRGLSFKATSEVILTLGTDPYVQVRGLSIAKANGDDSQIVQRLRFPRKGIVELVGQNLTIQGIPWVFFQNASNHPPQREKTSDVVQAFKNMLFKSSIPWRQRLSVVMLQNDITLFSQGWQETWTADDPLNPMKRFLGGKVRSFIAGGTRSNLVAAVSLAGIQRCELQLIQVPVLGRLNLKLTFAQGFGVDNLVLEDDALIAGVYGIDTSLGAIKSLSFKGSKATLRIGNMRFDIDLDKEPDGKGPKVVKSQCQE